MSTLRIILLRKQGTEEYVTGASLVFGEAQNAVIHRSEREAEKKISALKRQWRHWSETYARAPETCRWLECFSHPCPEFEMVHLEIEVPR